MDRRQYLALSGATLSSIAAGCTSLDSGNGAGDPTPTPTPSTTEERLAMVREYLEDEGYEIAEVDFFDGILVVEYASSARTESALLEESEPVVRAFRRALESGLDAEWLEAWLLDEDGSSVAVYTVHESSVRAWAAGELSDEELFRRVEENISWQ